MGYTTETMQELITKDWGFKFVPGEGYILTTLEGREISNPRRGRYWLDINEAVEAADQIEEERGG